MTTNIQQKQLDLQVVLLSTIIFEYTWVFFGNKLTNIVNCECCDT